MSGLSSQLSFQQINKSPNSTTLEKSAMEGIKSPNSTRIASAVDEVLPREIWREIGKRNKSRLDLFRFRSVCRRWRSSLPPPSPSSFPLRVPPPPGRNPKPDVEYFITEVTFYAANEETILLVEKEYRSGETQCSASALVHRKQAGIKLELPEFTQISNLSVLCKSHHLHNASPRYLNGKRVANKSNFSANRDVLKVEIIHSDGVTVDPDYSREQDLKLVAHLFDRKLAVLSLCGGAMNNNWETGFCNIRFDDIVNYRGHLYCVCEYGRVFVMDYNSLQITQVAALPNYGEVACIALMPGNRKTLHLAVVSEDLYMFVHLPKIGVGVNPKLYKLNLQLQRWVEAAQDLPDHVFIQNEQCNFTVTRDLILAANKGLKKPQLPRFCSWPEFVFVRAAVGFKHVDEHDRSGVLSRGCDLPNLAYSLSNSDSDSD